MLNRLIKFVGALFVICLPQFAISQEKVGDISLTDISTRITDVASWYLANNCTYHWIAMNRILFLKNVKWKRSHVVRSSTLFGRGLDGDATSDDRPYGGSLHIFDLLKGKENVLEGLSTKFNQTTGLACDIACSPDGKWLHWTDVQQTAYFAMIDGSHFTYCPQIGLLDWLSDNQHLVEINCGDDYELSNTRVIGRTKPSTSISKKKFPANSLDASETILITPSNELLGTNWNGDSKIVKEIKVSKVNLMGDKTNLKEYKILLSMKPKLEWLRFSPDGGRIAWIFSFENRSDTTLTGRYLYACNLDGSRMTKIGKINFAITDDFKKSIQWMPDNKHISFIRPLA